jgi:DNA-binding CsgD family transcriptional regulator
MVTAQLADAAHRGTHERLARNNLGAIVSALGTSRFADALLGFLKDVSDVEHVHFFELDGNRPHVLHSVSLDASGGAERQANMYLTRRLFSIDPWVLEWIEGASDTAALFHVSKSEVQGADMRSYYDAVQIADRVMACGPGEEGILGISLARSQASGGFDAAHMQLELVRDIALPLLIKHRDYCAQRAKFSQELLDIARMEERMQRTTKLPPREIQVAARILRGVTASGIALDLGIGRETVICYRKRLYEKLTLGSYHDLLSWYMGSIAADGEDLVN